MVIGENGIFGKAKVAKDETEYSQELESLKLAILEAKTENINASYEELLEVLEKDPKYTYIINKTKQLSAISQSEGNIKSFNDIPEGTEVIYIIPRDYEFGVDDKLNIIEPEDRIKHISEEEIQDNSDKYISYKVSSSKNTKGKKLYKLKDMSGNGNDAEIYNLDYNYNNDGIVFNGENGYAKINRVTTMTFPMTIEMTLENIEDKTQIFYLDADNNICLGIENGIICITAFTNTMEYEVPSDFFDGSIKNLIVTYNQDETDFIIYVNGEELTEEVEEDNWHAGISDGDFFVGKRQNKNYFKGTLYTLRVYNKALSQQEVTNTCNADINFIKNNGNQISRSNLLLEYVIKNNPENYKLTIKNLADNSNNNNNAECINAVITDDKKGIIFDGNESYAKINKVSDIAFPMTVEIIIENTENRNQVIYLDPENKICINTVNGVIGVTAYTYTMRYKLPNNFFEIGKKHITVVFNKDEKDFTIYINGVKLEEETNSDAKDAGIGNIMLIGRRESGNYFKGILYELNVYKKVLTEDEIKTRYNEIK